MEPPPRATHGNVRGIVGDAPVGREVCEPLDPAVALHEGDSRERARGRFTGRELVRNSDLNWVSPFSDREFPVRLPPGRGRIRERGHRSIEDALA